MPKALEDLRKKISKNLSGKVNPRTKKPYTTSEIWAIAQAQFKKMGDTEKKSCLISHVEYKSIEVKGKKEHHIYGFVSAPNVDSNGDLIPEHLQAKLVERINNGFANRGSWNHDFIIDGNVLPVASAKSELKIHPELNKQAAYVDVTLDPDSPKFDEVLEYAEQGKIKGFSIEYSKYPPSHPEQIGEKTVRVFDEIPAFGFGIIGGDMTPVNQLAYADGFEYKAYFENNEVKGMADKEEEKSKEGKEEKKEDTTEKKEETEEKKTEETETKGAEAKEDDKEKLEMKSFRTWKTEKEKTEKQSEFKALVDERLKEAMKGMVPTDNPMLVPGGKFDTEEMDTDINSFKAVLESDKTSLDKKYQAAIKLHNQIDPTGKRTLSPTGFTAGKGNMIPILQDRPFGLTGPRDNEFEVKASEYKARLDTVTNKTSDTDYYQNAAELNDIYDPVIRSHLNDKTTFYGLLRKIDASAYSDRWGFRVWRGRVAGEEGSSTNYFYDEGDAMTSQTASMVKAQQPFMWYRAVVEVSGQMIAAARGRGGIGDVFGKQVKRASADLLRAINADFFYISGSGTAGFTVGGRIMSLVYLLGTSELYGLDRSGTYTTFNGTTTGKSNSPNPAKTDLRLAFRTAEGNGANHNDLIIVCDFTQKDKILGLLDEAQRLTTVPRAGFEGLPSFDGVPIYADSQCTAGYIYILDMAHMLLAVQVAPTYEDLAKIVDSKKGFIKTYFNLVCTAPNHNYLYTGFATS